MSLHFDTSETCQILADGDCGVNKYEALAQVCSCGCVGCTRVYFESAKVNYQPSRDQLVTLLLRFQPKFFQVAGFAWCKSLGVGKI